MKEWKIVDNLDDGHTYIFELEEVVCDVKNGDDKCLANARLIAAAPKLLAACEDALETLLDIPDWPDLEYDHELEEQLKAAITGAKE